MTIEAQYLCPLLQVFDMPASLRFYRDVLGFEVVDTSDGEGDRIDWVWLELGEASLMLNTAYEQEHRPAEPDPARFAAHDDTSLYIGCSDVDAVYRHLHERGVPAKMPTVAPYGMKQLHVSDPDGFRICFQQRVK